jgi:hypothetical protein
MMAKIFYLWAILKHMKGSSDAMQITKVYFNCGLFTSFNYSHVELL